MKFVGRFFIKLLVCAIVVIMAGPVLAAENGCDDVENDAIVAELALCSTHAYNIRETKNPTGADKELMRDVIAMKTTLITQQMYKQYEQMESMLRRLKTQLEKAVLTTSLEAKGARSGNGGADGKGGAYVSRDPYVHIENAQNCNVLLNQKDFFACIEDNWRLINNKYNNGAGMSVELRKQLASDMKVLAGKVCGAGMKIYDEKCIRQGGIASRSDFQECLDKMTYVLTMASASSQSLGKVQSAAKGSFCVMDSNK